MTLNDAACKADQGDSSNMDIMKRAVLSAVISFAASSPAPGPGILSALLLHFLQLFTRCESARQYSSTYAH